MAWQMFKSLLVAAICVLPGWAGAQVTINVAVRADAAPFSFAKSGRDGFDRAAVIPGPLFRAGYRGYVVQICDAALNSAQTQLPDVTFVPMEVTTGSRFGDKRVDWHILCDPASLSAARLAEHAPTLPIYLSGIGFAKLSRIPKGIACQSIAGVADNTTTEHAGIRAVADSGAIPRWADQLRDAISSNTGATSTKMNCDAGEMPTVTHEETHGDLAQALCAGNILYYVGDLEIVRAAVDAVPGCEYELSETTYRDERYTIFTNTGTLGPEGVAALNVFRAELSRQVLQEDSVLLQAYRAYLGTTKKSRKLSAFYWGVAGAWE